MEKNVVTIQSDSDISHEDEADFTPGFGRMDLLLNSLIPPDDPLLEDSYHLEIRRNNVIPRSQDVEPPFTLDELEMTLKKTKPRKAPGQD